MHISTGGLHVISIGLGINRDFRLSVFGSSGRHLYLFLENWRILLTCLASSWTGSCLLGCATQFLTNLLNGQNSVLVFHSKFAVLSWVIVWSNKEQKHHCSGVVDLRKSLSREEITCRRTRKKHRWVPLYPNNKNRAKRFELSMRDWLK